MLPQMCWLPSPLPTLYLLPMMTLCGPWLGPPCPTGPGSLLRDLE